MTGLKFRRSLRLESLESRELLSGPTAEQQYMLQLMNMARTQPTAMVSWIRSHIDDNDRATMQHYGVQLENELSAIGSSSPVQPLAWSDALAASATQQSQYESDNQVQTHQGAGEKDLAGRLADQGYTNPSAYGENSYAYANSVDHAMKAFLTDWGVASKGHRGNLLQTNTPSDQTYSEVGVGIVATPSNSSVGPFVITQDFGRPANAHPQLVGVVFKDTDGDNFYTQGEGKGGLTVEVDNTRGKVTSIQTWDSGGYQIPLNPGSYTVKILDRQGNPVQYQNVTIGSDNVEVDFNLNKAPSVLPVAQNKTVIGNLNFDDSWAKSWWSSYTQP